MFPLTIPEDAWRVEDADEEIFLLYSQLQASSTVGSDFLDSGGLGFVDSRKEELMVRIDVTAPLTSQQKAAPPESPLPTKPRKRPLKKRQQDTKLDEPLEIRLFQDTTALRSRKGDTGSVLWRARQVLNCADGGTLQCQTNMSLSAYSVHLARALLSQQRFPPEHPFLPAAALFSCHVLELGSGTGLLSILLAPLVTRYTSTDLPSLLPLVRKNQAHNLSPANLAKIVVDDLDWVQLHNTPVPSRRAFFRIRSSSLIERSTSESPPQKGARKKSARTTSINDSKDRPERGIDLILAVDCIYNPSLIAPLLSTIDHFSGPRPGIDSSDTESEPKCATVLVVLELRSSDVAHEFLEGWLALPGKWEIWSVPILGARFAVWAGRRLWADIEGAAL